MKVYKTICITLSSATGIWNRGIGLCTQIDKSISEALKNMKMEYGVNNLELISTNIFSYTEHGENSLYVTVIAGTPNNIKNQEMGGR